ncbi:methyltransferase [uncultured Shewanella sp.]|uniref:methyltransferase n=1 Tax=uncultured Shewanella sp. TaxID=173975 RepID=UPI00263607E2|nr:methyltransferase [uncultured Shewanella sp.]
MHNIPKKSSHSVLFERLNSLLLQSRDLWQVRAFDCTSLPWADKFPHLAESVWAIPDKAIDDLDRVQSELIAVLQPALTQDLSDAGREWDLSLLNISAPMCDKPAADLLPTKALSHFSAGIKGRKFEQISAFTAQLTRCDSEVLEWCAGKGHLGRLIAKVHNRPVVSLEWQQSLCDAGSAFARQWHLPQRFICGDAFEAKLSQLKAEQQAVALHACGDLHVRLLQLASAAGTKNIAFSPCCYHLIRAKEYEGLSVGGRNSQLTLSRHDLQLPLQQSTIAGSKQQQLRHKEIAWRLGFDSLQREARGQDRYLPIPSVKQSQLSGDFSDFCLWAAQTKLVNLPDRVDFGYFEQLGLTRQRLTRRVDLVAHLFRSVLEHWLLLDRVCFLEEQGYSVTLNHFCSERVTPRNALIQAKK